jgi:hypothetical protein
MYHHDTGNKIFSRFRATNIIQYIINKGCIFVCYYAKFQGCILIGASAVLTSVIRTTAMLVLFIHSQALIVQDGPLASLFGVS